MIKFRDVQFYHAYNSINNPTVHQLNDDAKKFIKGKGGQRGKDT